MLKVKDPEEVDVVESQDGKEAAVETPVDAPGMRGVVGVGVATSWRLSGRIMGWMVAEKKCRWVYKGTALRR